MVPWTNAALPWGVAWMKIHVWLRGSLSQEDPPWAQGCGTHLVLQVPCLQVVQKNRLESKGGT